MGYQQLTSLHLAVELCGGQTSLAHKINIHLPKGKHTTQKTIWWWLNKSHKVSSHCVIPIEKATKGEVSRHDLRPDIYPKDAA